MAAAAASALQQDAAPVGQRYVGLGALGVQILVPRAAHGEGALCGQLDRFGLRLHG